jgi:aminoglycoside N3'-acetyltransferase
MAAGPTIAQALTKLGLKAGNTVLLVGPDESPCHLATPRQIVDQLIAALGPDGTVASPAFYLACRPGGAPNSLPPPFASALLEGHGALLSQHPTHPVVALGGLAEAITEGHTHKSVFGRGTPLFKLLQAHVKILQIGCDIAANPMGYVAEEIADAPYVNRSRLATYTDPSGNTVSRWIRQPGCCQGFSEVADDLRTGGGLTEISVRSTILRLIDSRKFVDTAVEALSAACDALLCTLPDCVLCAESRAMIAAKAAEDSDQEITELAEEEERLARSVEQRLSGGTARFVDGSDTHFSPN